MYILTVYLNFDKYDFSCSIILYIIQCIERFAIRWREFIYFLFLQRRHTCSVVDNVFDIDTGMEKNLIDNCAII